MVPSRGTDGLGTGPRWSREKRVERPGSEPGLVHSFCCTVSGLLGPLCTVDLRYFRGPHPGPCLCPVITLLIALGLFQTLTQLLPGYSRRLTTVYMVPLHAPSVSLLAHPPLALERHDSIEKIFRF